MIAVIIVSVTSLVLVGCWDRMRTAWDQLSTASQREREARYLAEQKIIAQRWTREKD